MATRHVPLYSPPYSLSMRLLAGHSSLQNFLDSRLCFICVSSLRAVRAQCGHLLGCRPCAQRLRDCPFCRQPIRFTYNIDRAAVRNSSPSSTTTTSTSLFSSPTARSCPPRISYHTTTSTETSSALQEDPETPETQRALAVQDSVVQCYVCHTEWPDLLQWKEHLSQGLHRRAQLLAPHASPDGPFCEHCKTCDFYSYDPRSWQLHVGLHSPGGTSEQSGRSAGDMEDAQGLSLLTPPVRSQTYTPAFRRNRHSRSTDWPRPSPGSHRDIRS